MKTTHWLRNWYNKPINTTDCRISLVVTVARLVLLLLLGQLVVLPRHVAVVYDDGGVIHDKAGSWDTVLIVLVANLTTIFLIPPAL